MVIGSTGNLKGDSLKVSPQKRLVTWGLRKLNLEFWKGPYVIILGIVVMNM